MASSIQLIDWPPPEAVYWECPYCGPAAYSTLRANSDGSRSGPGLLASVRSVVDARVLKCLECQGEHLTTYYRDGLARVAGGHQKGWAGSFEFMATDNMGRWKLMKPAACSTG